MHKNFMKKSSIILRVAHNAVLLTTSKDNMVTKTYYVFTSFYIVSKQDYVQSIETK